MNNAKPPFRLPGGFQPAAAPVSSGPAGWNGTTAGAGFALSGADLAQAQPEPVPRQSPQFLCDAGITAAAMGCIDAAVATLQEATSLDPTLAEAWRALAPLLHLTGDAQGAASAWARATTAKAGPKRPARTLSAGKLAQAERKLREAVAASRPRDPAGVLREHLFAAPTDVAALRLLAEVESQAGDLETALLLLERALEFAPDYIGARQDYTYALMAASQWIKALEQAERLVAHDSRDQAYRILQADLLATIGDVGRAVDILQAIIRRAPPRQPRFWISYARALRRVGRSAESAQAYRTCIELAPATGEAYWGIANLKFEALSGSELAAIRAHLAGTAISDTDRLHFHYALAYALEKSGDYAASFSHYEQGGRLRRAQAEAAPNAYNPDETSSRVHRARQVFTPSLFAAHAGQGCPDPAPIFVLGMPRAGSTLIEQILASHSMVEGTTELPDMGYIVSDLLSPRRATGGQTYPESIAALSADDLAALGARYIETSRAFRKSDRPFFVDKMPGNWMNVGLIQLILPNAKIIDARRHPMACCFATFKQIMVGGSNGAYDLTFIGRRYNDYVDLMAHFDTVLPGRVHRVRYEDMVENTEAEIRSLLAYCELPFEAACLRFWENDRAVTTPSAEQVRKPIFRDGLDQWKNFEPWLGQLKAVLHTPMPASNVPN